MAGITRASHRNQPCHSIYLSSLKTKSSLLSIRSTKVRTNVKFMVLILCVETVFVITKASSTCRIPSLFHFGRQPQQSSFHLLFTTPRGGSQKSAVAASPTPLTRTMSTNTNHNSTSSPKTNQPQQQMPLPPEEGGDIPKEDSTIDVLGGGAINEKERKSRVPDITGYSTNNNYNKGGGSGTTRSTILDTTKTSQSKFDPCHDKSHLYHALEGLERYPNYLSRWSTNDMDQIEKALEQQLVKVRQQKQSVQERRNGIHQLVQSMLEQTDTEKPSRPPVTATEPSKNEGLVDLTSLKTLRTPPTSWEELLALDILNPSTVQAILKSKQFQKKIRKKQKSFNNKTSRLPPTFEDVLQGKVNVEIDPAQLEEIMEQEMFDVYSLPVFTEEFCIKLQQYIKQVILHSEREEFAYLNLGRRIVDLDTVGLGWVNDLLLHLIMRPISRLLYKSSETLDELDWRQGYIAGYAATPSQEKGTTRHRLVSHTDDSEITLNICVGDNFEGGKLQFRGLRGTEEGDHGQTLIGDFEPRLGTALIHAGRHLHEVTQVTAGERYAYIVWARSWGGSRSQTCPCCWLNRRQGNSCICGARWN